MEKKHPIIHRLSGFNQPKLVVDRISLSPSGYGWFYGFRRLDSAQVTSGSSSSIYTAKSSGRLSLAGRRAKNVRLADGPGEELENVWELQFF